jgi:hypothetical protein
MEATDIAFVGNEPQLKGTGYGLSKSVNTSTTTVNGKKITTKKTTIFNGDGSKQITEETFEADDENNNQLRSTKTYS